MRPCSFVVFIAGCCWLGCQSGATSDEQSAASAAPAAAAATAGQHPGQPESRSESQQDPYARDVENLCFAEERSGALQRPEAERVMVVAMWLGQALKTAEGRTFLARVSQAGPAEKVVLLDSEAERLGMPECPLARAWSAGLKK